MNGKIKFTSLPKAEGEKYPLDFLGLEEAKKAKRFHESFDAYKKTPLRELKGLAEALGVETVLLKDESYRFGLNAFKVLGGSYAIGRYIADMLHEDIDNLPYERLISEDVRKRLGDLTFITATDGNHGRGIAWTAKRLGQKSIVYMPKGSSEERLRNIRREGAEASITDLNYDEAVRLANREAEEKGYIMVQDTAWEGYEDIPVWIMQGYTTIACEIYEQMQERKMEKPTHIFLQAGVGSFAGAIGGFFASVYGAERPVVTIVEPEKADCLYQTASHNDGRLYFAAEKMDSVMAGLNCGEPNYIGWRVLHDYADHFAAFPDFVTAKGMRILGNPTGGDEKVTAGESGAAGLGFAAEVLEKESLRDLRDAIGLDKSSRILCISTEGDTDKKSYRDIVWNGKFPSFE